MAHCGLPPGEHLAMSEDTVATTQGWGATACNKWRLRMLAIQAQDRATTVNDLVSSKLSIMSKFEIPTLGADEMSQRVKVPSTKT